MWPSCASCFHFPLHACALCILSCRSSQPLVDVQQSRQGEGTLLCQAVDLALGGHTVLMLVGSWLPGGLWPPVPARFGQYFLHPVGTARVLSPSMLRRHVLMHAVPHTTKIHLITIL